MSSVSDDQLVKVSTEAATELVQTFYQALCSNRESIASFYAPVASKILFNGNTVADGAAVQDIFVNQMPHAHYEAQSYDCQVINRAYPTVTESGIKPAAQMTIKDMSILVIVSGHVRYGENRDQPQRGFSETFVLVPNPSAERGKRRRDWLIQSKTSALSSDMCRESHGNKDMDERFAYICRSL